MNCDAIPCEALTWAGMSRIKWDFCFAFQIDSFEENAVYFSTGAEKLDSPGFAFLYAFQKYGRHVRRFQSS